MDELTQKTIGYWRTDELTCLWTWNTIKSVIQDLLQIKIPIKYPICKEALDLDLTYCYLSSKTYRRGQS